jgi:hypothetical protein
MYFWKNLWMSIAPDLLAPLDVRWMLLVIPAAARRGGNSDALLARWVGGPAAVSDAHLSGVDHSPTSGCRPPGKPKTTASRLRQAMAGTTRDHRRPNLPRRRTETRGVHFIVAFRASGACMVSLKITGTFFHLAEDRLRTAHADAADHQQAHSALPT